MRFRDNHRIGARAQILEHVLGGVALQTRGIIRKDAHGDEEKRTGNQCTETYCSILELRLGRSVGDTRHADPLPAESSSLRTQILRVYVRFVNATGPLCDTGVSRAPVFVRLQSVKTITV